MRLVYKREAKTRPSPEPKKIKQEVLDFARYYRQINPDFVDMFGDVVGFYCEKTDSFHIVEINSEYQYFIKK